MKFFKLKVEKMNQLSVIVFLLLSVFVYAENYRITKPNMWEVEWSTDAIKVLYGHDRNITQKDSKVIIVAPKLAKGRGEFIPT